MLIPPSCVVCDALLPPQEPVGICGNCYPTLPQWDWAQTSPPPLPKHVDSFWAPFVYEPPINDLIVRLKFADHSQLATVLAKFLCAAPVPTSALLMPVPLHQQRLRKRLYNQAAELARQWVKLQPRQLELTALKRIRPTRPQTGQSAAARKRNLAGAFSADEALVSGKDIILLDDVWTTGSTAGTCARMLKQAGANRVDVVTVAYVAP